MAAYAKRSLLGYLFVAYALLLCWAVFYLSHYQWSHDASDTETPSALIEATNAPIETESQTSVALGQAIKPPSKPDFRQIKDIGERKLAFFAYLRPFVQQQNARIRLQRKDLLAIAKHWRDNNRLSRAYTRRLRELNALYDIEQTEIDAQIEELMLRVNTLPEALALAQAASESAWGKSRFARLGNNYFGQWCFAKGCGMVPAKRGPDKTHEVAIFADTRASVAAYFHNLNTFHAYSELRQTRYQLTLKGEAVGAFALIPALGSYAEKGEDYLDDLRAIIRQNALE